MNETPASGVRTFGSFSLDADRGCLLVEGVEVPLRPKTFALLSYLSAHAGRLVSKEELIKAVWRGAIVSDDVLVQSVGELRRALGEKGAGIIRTIPRRGYRFDAEVSLVTPAVDQPELRPASQPEMQPVHQSELRPGLRPVQQPGQRRRWALAFAAITLLATTAGGVWTVIAHKADAMSQARAKPAIAVLPFVNLDDTPDRQYFVDGLTQEVIAALGRFSSLAVVSWDAVLPYRDAAGDPGKAARDLDVQYQIKGSVRRTAERVFIKAQLVNPQGWVLWSREFDERLVDLFPLQEKLIQEISAVLALQVANFEVQRVAWTTRPGNLDAYDYLLRARSVSPDGPNGLAEAREMLKQAIALDSGYAAAWSARALTYLISAGEGWGEPPARRLEQAQDAARKALQLDPTDVLAHVVLGRVHLIYSQHDNARDEMEQALAINPNDSLALEGYGEILLWQGHTDQAIEVLRTALRIRPGMKGSERFALGLGYYLKGRCSDVMALAQSGQAPTQSEITTPPLLLLAACQAQLGHTDVAAQLLQRARDADPLYDDHVRAFGAWLQQPQDLKRLRDGLVRAGQPPVWEASISAGY